VCVHIYWCIFVQLCKKYSECLVLINIKFVTKCLVDELGIKNKFCQKYIVLRPQKVNKLFACLIL